MTQKSNPIDIAPDSIFITWRGSPVRIGLRTWRHLLNLKSGTMKAEMASQFCSTTCDTRFGDSSNSASGDQSARTRDPWYWHSTPDFSRDTSNRSWPCSNGTETQTSNHGCGRNGRPRHPIDSSHLSQTVCCPPSSSMIPVKPSLTPCLPVVANVQHIVDDNVDRYPQALRDNPYMRKGMLEQAITVAAAKAVSNWRIAAPQYYWLRTGAGRVRSRCSRFRSRRRIELILRSSSTVTRSMALHRKSSACYRAHTATSRVGIQECATRDTPGVLLVGSSGVRERAGVVDAADSGDGTWRPCRANNACPVCSAVGGCLLRADNREVLCRNVELVIGFTTCSGSTAWRHEAVWQPVAKVGMIQLYRAALRPDR